MKNTIKNNDVPHPGRSAAGNIPAPKTEILFSSSLPAENCACGDSRSVFSKNKNKKSAVTRFVNPASDSILNGKLLTIS